MKAAILFFGLLFFLSCTHLPPAKPTGLLPKDFWKDQALRWEETARLSAKVYLSYRGPKESVGGRGRLISELPDRFHLELRDPFGHLRYQLTEFGNLVVAYYPTEHLAYVDERGGTAYLRKTLGISRPFAEFQTFFLGLLPKRWKKSDFSSWQWDATRGLYRAEWKTGQESFTLYVDGTTAALHELVIESVQETLDVTYSDFQKCCSESSDRLSIGHDVKMTRSESSIELEWNEIEKLSEPSASENYKPNLPLEVQKILLN